VGIGGGVGYSMLGGTHHTPEDVAIMSALPNMAVVAPCDPVETQDATWACARREGPTYLRLGKAGEPVLTGQAPDAFTFGKIRFLQHGEDVCILSYGPIMKMAKEVADQLAKQGRSTALVSVHTLKPLDRAPCALHCFTLKDEFIHAYGTHADLLAAHGLSARNIVNEVTAKEAKKSYWAVSARMAG
jgi:transketolase